MMLKSWLRILLKMIGRCFFGGAFDKLRINSTHKIHWESDWESLLTVSCIFSTRFFVGFWGALATTSKTTSHIIFRGIFYDDSKILTHNPAENGWAMFPSGGSFDKLRINSTLKIHWESNWKPLLIFKHTAFFVTGDGCLRTMTMTMTMTYWVSVTGDGR